MGPGLRRGDGGDSALRSAVSAVGVPPTVARRTVMLDESDWARLARYLAGECSPDEAAAVRERMDRDPAWRAQAEAMRVAWDAAAAPPRAWDTDAAWARLAARASVRARHAAPVRHAPMAPVVPV